MNRKISHNRPMRFTFDLSDQSADSIIDSRDVMDCESSDILPDYHEALADSVIEINREALLPVSDFKDSTCNLRAVSTSLRRAISGSDKSRLCYGLLGYAYGA